VFEHENTYKFERIEQFMHLIPISCSNDDIRDARRPVFEQCGDYLSNREKREEFSISILTLSGQLFSGNGLLVTFADIG
jgi:hypothetical protein